MALIYSPTVLDILGSEFDDFTYLPADGTRGGILLAWKSRAVTISDPLFTRNALTGKVSVASGTPWWLTTVYGPQDDADKILFLQELRDIRAACPGPWMLCGDFNLIPRRGQEHGWPASAHDGKVAPHHQRPRLEGDISQRASLHVVE